MATVVSKSGWNLVSVHQRMSGQTQDGTVEPISRRQFLRRKREQGKKHFLYSADHEQDRQPYPVVPCSAESADDTLCRRSSSFQCKPRRAFGAEFVSLSC